MRRAIATTLLTALGFFAFAGVATAQEKGQPKLKEEAKACIEKLEKGGDLEECQEAPSPILPEPKEIFWQSLSFIILLGLLWKFAYPSIKKTMEARAERIRNNLDEAERVKAEAHTILDEYQRQLADAKNESNRIIEEARQTADQLRKDLVQRAESEVGELRERSQEEIRAAQERATADLQARVGGLAIELAEKVVESSLDRDANIRLIESYIEQVGSRR